MSQKTSEIGQRTWGIMKGVMAMASQKVEELARDNPNWPSNNFPRNENDRNGHYQEYNQQNNQSWNSSAGGGQPSSAGQNNSYQSSSWDDWDNDDMRKKEPAKASGAHNNDDWAGWDDPKDDEYDSSYQSASNKNAAGQNGKPGDRWTGGGFM